MLMNIDTDDLLFIQRILSITHVILLLHNILTQNRNNACFIVYINESIVKR